MDWLVSEMAIIGVSASRATTQIIASRKMLLVVWLFLVITTMLTSIGLSQGGIVHDLSSYVAPVWLWSEIGLGSYASFFDVKPPGLHMSLYAWMQVFDVSLVGFIILDIALWLAVLYLTWVLLGKVCSSGTRLAFLVGVQVVTLAVGGHSQIVLSEILGLLFLLLGALKIQQRNVLSAFLAGLFVAFSSQVKDVFLFCILAGIIFLLIRKPMSKRSLLAYVGGALLAALLVLGYLWRTDSLFPYFEILSFKSTQFSLLTTLARLTTTEFVLYVSLLVVTIGVLTLCIGSMVFRHSRARLSRVIEKMPEASVLYGLLFIAVWLGFLWQGKPPRGGYVTVLIFTGVLVAGSISHALRDTCLTRMTTGSKGFLAWFQRWFPVWIAAIAIAVLTISGVPARAADAISESRWNLNESAQTRYDHIRDLAETDECVQDAYGWAAGATYIYTLRVPCSRFFLSSLIVSESEVMTYRQDLLARPPSVVLYQPSAADVDVGEFEKSVFPWQYVLTSCYRNEIEWNVWVSVRRGEAARRCIGDALTSVGMGVT